MPPRIVDRNETVSSSVSKMSYLILVAEVDTSDSSP